MWSLSLHACFFLQQKPYCANCDVWGSAGATEYDTALTSDSAYDNSGTSYAHSGEGAKPEGFRNYNNKNKLSDVSMLI